MKGVHAGVAKVDGHSIPAFMGQGPTDGVTNLVTIAGALTLKAGKQQLEGSATVSVAEGGTAQVEIRLEPRVPKSR